MKRLTIGTLFLVFILAACASGTSTTSTDSSATPSSSSEASLPDLEVLDIEEIDDGAKITLNNAGTAPAGDFNLHIELSKDGNTVGEFNKKVNGIAAGEEKIVETSFSGTEYGLMYVKADSYNVIVESDEENNEFGF